MSTFLFLVFPLLAGKLGHYALILDDPPLARQVTRQALATSQAAAVRRALTLKQQSLRSTLAERKIAATGSIHTLLNAVFVAAAQDRVPELQAMPGVRAVIPMPRLHRAMNKAIGLINAPQAWSALGGVASAGAGIKIAILDTGIDETHPAFQDPSLATPPGFPKGTAADLVHATNKVIAVRSYVQTLALYVGLPVDPDYTRPDDLSARDRVGHGTALAMIAAGVTNSAPIAPMTGVAPKAWLGNYKIFGSPGVNDDTLADVVLQALDDAFNDGMDIAVVALSAPASLSLPDDPLAEAVENAALGNMTVVVPAGNDGAPGLSTIDTPGTSPSAITVGTSSNTHLVNPVVSTSATKYNARWSDGPQPTVAFSAPLMDASTLCSAGGSLAGGIALIQRGDCSFFTKVANAEQAGAVAAVIFRESGANSLFEPTGLGTTGIPSALIGADDGAALKKLLASQPGSNLTFDPNPVETLTNTPETVAGFSSRGPGITGNAIKPELVAPGTSIYTAAQNYDPNGDLFNPTRYAAADGTSFSAAMVAGAAAIVKQAHSGYTAAQLKAALANTAGAGLNDTDSSPARVTAVGSGKLDVENALATTITAVPATISFGEVSGGLVSRTVTIANNGTSPANLQIVPAQRDPDAHARVQANPTSLSLSPGQSAPVTISMTGSIPLPGSYEGTINVTGGSVPLRIPYLYLVSDGVPSNLIPLQSDFVADVGSQVTLLLKVVDRYGVSLPNVPVQFSPSSAVMAADAATGKLGVASATFQVSSQTGEQSFTAKAGGVNLEFDGRARLAPAIGINGIQNAGSFLLGEGLAPGSYMTIRGTGLSESREVFGTPYLPVSLAGVSVSFDVPSKGLSLPGRIHFVSAGQINVQIPWELAGVDSAIVKVSIGNSQSYSVAVPITPVSPAFFEYQEASTGYTLAAARDENGAVVSSDNPVQRGHVIVFYVNGLGAVDNPVPTGEPTPLQPYARTLVTLAVSIGGQPAGFQFSGLSPSSIGLYQINVVVPTNISPGFQQAVISMGEVTSKSTTVRVQ